MRLLSWQADSTGEKWTREFDEWIVTTIENQKVDDLLKYKEIAPNVQIALPTHEHFVPILVTQGTDIEKESSISFPIEGFAYGTFTKRSVQFG
jgi:4,5-DOPA dioxygenase extradiol